MSLTPAMQNFNEKVRQMNQSSGKQLVLPSKEARNLQADIYTLLAIITELSVVKPVPLDAVLTINMDGGAFSDI